jgi:hypothetical protein
MATNFHTAEPCSGHKPNDNNEAMIFLKVYIKLLNNKIISINAIKTINIIFGTYSFIFKDKECQ